MRKWIVVTALGAALFSLPALANVAGGPYHESADRCREAGENVQHCQRVAWRGKPAENRQFFVQSGNDLNSHRWLDGSPRSTLSPHASRGSERSSTDPDSGYWIQW